MKAGFAVADITPELGIYLTGYGRPERLAAAVHSPLTATVMVLQDGEKTVAVIGFDWCSMDIQMAQEFRQAIAAASGIPEENILMGCSHTHSAPHTTYRRSLGRTTVDPENKGIAYAKKSLGAVCEAVCRAIGSLQEAEAGFGAGKTETGVSRRGLDENGAISYFFVGDPDMIHDDNMTAVLFRNRETRETIGILVHCSAHNTCMGGFDRNISSDWCGVMKKRVGERYHAPVLFLNGACGDVGPRTNRPVANATLHGFAAGGGDGPAAAEEVGYRAATDALRLLENLRDFRSDLPLKTQLASIRMPQEIPMSEDEARAVIEQFERENAGGRKEPPTKYLVARRSLATWKEPPQPELEFKQSLIAFGPVALAPFPFEMFSVFSLRLRKYGPVEYTLLCSLANGCYGYLPDRGAIAVGGYEVTWRSCSREYVTKPEAGDLAVVQTLKALREMQK